MLDGVTGQVVGRVSLPREYSRTPCGYNENEPKTLGPVVGSDGAAYLLVHKSVREATGTCSAQVTVLAEVGWTLLRLAPSGEVTSIVVDQTDFLTPEQFLPDGTGGLLLRAKRTIGNQVEARLIRFDAEWERTEHVIGLATRIDLVGEAGTVFLQSRTGNDNFYGITQAFDVTTGASLWTASPGWRLVAAKPDGGGTGVGSGGELLDIDATGQLAGTMVVGMLMDPIQRNSSLIGQGSGEVKAVAAERPNATQYSTGLTRVGVAFYEPSAFGNDQGQSATRTPVLATYVAVPFFFTDGSYTAAEYKNQFSNYFIGGHINALPQFRIGNEARADRFLKELASHQDAVGFIGHSLVVNNHNPPLGSIGLKLDDKFIVKQMTPQIYHGAPYGPATTVVLNQINTKARILFFAACDTQSTFESLWDINAQTTKRAMIVPTIQAVGLYWGAQAWVQIALKLGEGQTVSQAVAHANSFLSSRNQQLQFRIVGDGNAKLK